MNRISLNPVENKNCLLEGDILAVFNQQQENSNQIRQGMTPEQIAEIVSDYLIDIVKKQFEKAKQEYQLTEK